MKLRFLLPLMVGSPALAQSPVDNVGGDARFLTLTYSADRIVQLPTAADTVQTVLFGQGETVRSVILSDPGAYIVGVSGKGDSLSLRPNGRSAPAIMSIRTDTRAYEIELVAADQQSVPAVVRFTYGPTLGAVPRSLDSILQAEGFAYRMGGSAALRPASIRDDGAKTYIAWARDQAMPAAFSVGASGREEMVDGYMRDGLFTIDRVYENLVFRMDRKESFAKRIRTRGTHDRK